MLKETIRRFPDLRLFLILISSQPIEAEAALRGVSHALGVTPDEQAIQTLAERSAEHYGDRVVDQQIAQLTLNGRPNLPGRDLDDLVIRAALCGSLRADLRRCTHPTLREVTLLGYLLTLGMPGSKTNFVRASLGSSEQALERYAQNAEEGGTLRLPVIQEPKPHKDTVSVPPTT